MLIKNKLILLIALILILSFSFALETRGGIFNGGFEFGTGSTSTDATWIGDENYGWALDFSNSSVTGIASFNSTTKYKGSKSIDLNMITGTAGLTSLAVRPIINFSTTSNDVKHLVRLKPSTNYKLSAWIKTIGITGSASQGISIELMQYSASLGEPIVRNTTSGITGTNDWTYVSTNITTSSNVVYGSTGIYINSIGYAIVDDIRLEEVDTVSLSTQQQGRPSITITGVTDTNAIDQSQTTQDGSYAVGDVGGIDYNVVQSFIPNQQKLTKIIVQKRITSGNPNGNLIFSIRSGTLSMYSSTILSLKSYTPSEWSNIPDDSYVEIDLPTILDANGTNTYWIVITDSNANESNNNQYRLYINTAGGYSNGKALLNNVDYGADLYFKTHFAKHSSSVDLNVVAPDGTSELKSYDVNGDILTDANITINPDGTGRYLHTANFSTLANAQKHANDIYRAGFGNFGASNGMINGWKYEDSYIVSEASESDRNIQTKYVLPTGCTLNGLTALWNISSNNGTPDMNLQYSNNGTTWYHLDAHNSTGFLARNATTTGLDGNNTFYLRIINTGGYPRIKQIGIDANLSCPSLTTPLFKSGTNTVYTMNKDADNQAGATLTPSLMSNINFSFTAPTTTFSSFQVPNTTDQNITLTCTNSTSGCKTINYNINNTGWKDKTNHDLNYFIQNHTSYGKGITSTAFTSSVPFQFLQTISGSIGQAPGAGPEHPVYVKFNIYYRDGTTVETPTYGGVHTTNFSYTATKDYKDINYITSTTSGDNFYIQNLNADLNIYYNNPSRISFLFSGAGSHSIQYFSTDNSDNTETIKTSTFTTYGNIRFNMYDENTGTALTGVTINDGTTDYSTGADYYYDFNLQGTTTQTKTYTISKTGYSTRTYTLDQNQFQDLNINFALIPNTVDVDIPFKVYQTDETTLFINTFVELKDKDTNYTVGRLKTNSSGEATFNIRTDDPNYYVFVDNGAYVYSPVALTILYPKDEETLAQITEKWKIEISQNLYAYYPDLNTTKIVYLLPNTALPYNIKIGDMNGNYFQRTYSKLYPGNPLTDTLQPYLVKTTTGLLTTITTKNAITNTNISGITIKIYKFTPGQGRTLVEQVTTDNKGQAISLLVLGAEYDFECYSGTTFIKTYTITATSSTIFIYLQPTTETPETSPSGFAVKYTPTYSGLNKLNVGTQVFTQTGFNNYGVSVTYTSQIIQGTVLSSQSYTGSDANKTFSHTINWVDINNDVPVISRLTITYGGKNYVYQTNYIVNDSFGTNYNLLEGLSTGLRSDAGCEATGICFPLMTIALLLSIGLTIWVAMSMGQLGQQTAGIVLLLAMVVFTYLSWIPFELTVACVLILLAFVVNERRN